MDENANQPQENVAPAAYVSPPQGQGGGLKKIISLVIGLAVVLGLVLVVIVFILPHLSGGGSKNVTLTYWGVWEDTAPFEAAAADFRRENPDVKITIEKQDVKALGKYAQRLATRISEGTGPDIFRYHESWLPEISNYLLPLPQEVVSADELDTKFYPTVEKDLKRGGAYYGIPIHFDTLALFINTQIFKNEGISSYPATWDDLISTARKLTVKDSEGRITQSGVALGTYDNIAHASDIVSLLLIQNGADLQNLNGPAKQSASDALDFYTSFAKGESKVWDDTLDNSKLAFAKGNLAMFIGYSWDIFELKAINPNLQFVTAPVPHLPSRNSTVASYWVEGVSAKSAHPKEAFEFLKFLATRKNMEQFYTTEAKTRAFGELYPRSDMASLLKDNSLVYPFVSQGNDAVSTIFASDTHDAAMVDALNNYLGNAIRSINNNGTSPESAIETLNDGVTQQLTQYAGKK